MQYGPYQALGTHWWFFSHTAASLHSILQCLFCVRSIKVNKTWSLHTRGWDCNRRVFAQNERTSSSPFHVSLLCSPSALPPGSQLLRGEGQPLTSSFSLVVIQPRACAQHVAKLWSVRCVWDSLCLWGAHRLWGGEMKEHHGAQRLLWLLCHSFPPVSWLHLALHRVY